ncbi:hypothetical protein [Morganella morganii]|uniref:hypothetical protein n=1 Tax=Morganella morganii TaxID=582 RepID=UPI000DD7DDCE|nr:hypothetical protein [Morganella morganii]
MKNTIPPMTDPDGKNWPQPPTDNILIDDHHALMTQSDFNQLIDYSHSVPSGVYPGKMWKTTAQGGRQFLWWFGELPGHDDTCTNNRREILIVEDRLK